MAHLRKREILATIKKSLKIWPVTSILGPRQCGKSTFLRDLLELGDRSSFISLDKKADRKTANENPELFLSRFTQFPVIIDEAHKAPDLFDEIKAVVDQKRRPGQFILSGSVYFSKKIGIQESLTGRSAVFRMDTMTLPETTASSKINLNDLNLYFKKGGMPGVCFTRNLSDSGSYWDQWIETSCHRDLKIFSQGRFSGDLAEEILENISKLEIPTISEIASKTGVDARRIKTHLEALIDLFIVRPVAPSSRGIGKPIFLPFDCGLASHYGAPPRRLWQVGFLVHQLNQAVFAGNKPKMPRYYMTSRHSFIDFETNQNEFHLYTDKPNPGRSELMTIAAAKKASPKHELYIHCATDAFSSTNDDGTHWMSWAEGYKRSFL